MKQIINSKLYDTATADAVGSYGYSSGDFYLGETLYEMQTGGFFLHRAGDAEECIIPCTELEAKAWAHRYLGLDLDTYTTTFRAVEE